MPPTQEMEQPVPHAPPLPPPKPSTCQSSIKILLHLRILSVALMVLGSGAGLLLRFYFIHGGSRRWLSTFIQTAGWPIQLIPIFFSSSVNNRRAFNLPPSVLSLSAVLGLFFGLGCFMYGYGSSYLPASTSSILLSSTLSFTAIFCFFINRQRFTAYSINSVVLLTLGPIVLGLDAAKDRPLGETNRLYVLGLVMILLGAALSGLILPVMERLFKMVKDGGDYGTVMEIQLVMGAFASGFALVGMAINKDFQVIAREARNFEFGEMKYYTVLLCDALLFQFYNLGSAGIISFFSSLFAGILSTVLLLVSEILAVLIFHEKFNESKGIALVLCLWGFTSYLYGENKQSKKIKKLEVEIPLPIP